MDESVVFFFTKEYPFGSGETYIENEIGTLCRNFRKVIIVPSDYFGAVTDTQRQVPDNAELYLVNSDKSVTSVMASFSERLRILLPEFIAEKDKFRFLKEFRRYLGILNYQFLCARRFESLLQKYKDQKKIFYTYWLHNSCILLGILKNEKKINSFVSRAHSLDLYHNDWPFAYNEGIKVLPFQNFKTRMASAVYSISKAGEKYLKKKFPSIKDKFHTSYLGVNDNGTGKWNSDDVFTIVSCSAMNSHKRIKEIAETFFRLNFPARWIHFGDGPEKPVVEKMLASKPSHLEVELRGQTPNAELMRFYKNITVNVFINLSIVEGVPVSLMEAASFGIPLIATDVFGNSEIVNEETGFLVSSDFQVSEVAEIIEGLKNDVTKQEALRKSAREFCLKNFSNVTNFNRFHSELKNYIN